MMRLAAAILIMLVRLQDGLTPIHLGENLTGEITATNPQPEYTLTVDAPGSVIVQILPLSADVPGFRVIDGSGVVLAQGIPAEGSTLVTAAAALPTSGTYRLVVIGEIGAQYVISVGEGEIVPPPTPLVMGGRLSGVVDQDAPSKVYALRGDSTLFLYVTAESSAAAPVITVYNGAGDVIALVGAEVQGITLRLRQSLGGYIILIAHGGSAGEERYSLCADSASEPDARCPVYEPPPEATTEPTPNGDANGTPIPPGTCAVESGVVVNVRSEPSLNAEVVTQLPIGSRASVLGRSPDAIWWMVLYDRMTGWVSSTVTTTTGACESVETVFPN